MYMYIYVLYHNHPFPIKKQILVSRCILSPIFRQTQVGVDSGRQPQTPETPAKIRFYLSAKLV